MVDETEENGRQQQRRKPATLYDFVTDTSWHTGLFDNEKDRRVTDSSTKALLARRLNSVQNSLEQVARQERSSGTPVEHLPDSDLLKDIHTYASDFYSSISQATHDYGSFDETALLALGILLEESCKEALGSTGDMVFTEPQSRDNARALNKMAAHQIIGKVVPQEVREYQSPAESEDEDIARAKPQKRQRKGNVDPV